MEILDVNGAVRRATRVGRGARTAQLYPAGPAASGLLAVDLLEVEPGGSTDTLQHAEEHVLFVLAGLGEARSGDTSVNLKVGSALFVAARESHTLTNMGAEVLRVLVSTPLLVRSERALGLTAQGSLTPRVPEAEVEREPERAPERARALRETASGALEGATTRAEQAAGGNEVEEAPLPDISSLMKRGSDVAAGARGERKRSAPEVEPETIVTEGNTVEEEEEGEERPELMELSVVFDGGSRGNPGQGYGSFLVQSPGRKPVIKRVEFGDNYTNNQAEYDSLIACLQYIVERLTATNRTPSQVALDIKCDSDLLVNQLQGNYKVKDAGLRQRHTKAQELLEQFGAWLITWHPREESVKLLGH